MDIPGQISYNQGKSDQSLYGTDEIFRTEKKGRLPRTNGEWVGIPGNGQWFSYNPQVLEITHGEGVTFVGERPDFSTWGPERLFFQEGELKGRKADFKEIYKALMKERGFASQAEAKKWLRTNKLSPHHESRTIIELVPTALHSNIPHTGSASDLRKESFNE